MVKRRIKSLWRGVFQLNHQVFTLYAHAYSEKQAWSIFCRRIADKHGISTYNVMDYFNGDKVNYEITVEVEFQEDEEQIA